MGLGMVFSWGLMGFCVYLLLPEVSSRGALGLIVHEG